MREPIAPTVTGWIIALLHAGLLTACQPVIRVEAPDDPIVINLNVTIEQEVRIRIEGEAEALLRERDDIF